MKYLELIKGQFTADHEARAKQLEPYVAYSEEAGGVMYNFIPEPVVGPADNEIWYTSSDGNVVSPSGSFGASIVSNEYNDGKGIITFDGPVTQIGLDSFHQKTSLTSVTIPNSVTSIGGFAFYNCSALTSITIPNSVTSIGGEAFSNTPWYNSLPEGVVYINNVLYGYKGSMPANTSIDIKDGTISISSSAFYRCSSLTSITIPNSVTSIGDYAFSGCSSLTSVTIPNSVTSIGDRAFEDCSSLTSVTIPNSVTSIGEYAFYKCSGLASVTIGSSVMGIGKKAFYNCTGLNSITYEGTTEQWNSITKGVNWNSNVPATYVQCSDGQVAL